MREELGCSNASRIRITNYSILVINKLAKVGGEVLTTWAVTAKQNPPGNHECSQVQSRGGSTTLDATIMDGRIHMFSA